MLFPSPVTPPTAYPPLPGADFSLPDIFRTPVESDERVEVGIDPDGSPVSVVVTQTLVLHQKADYRLMISAPVLDVASGPGTESLPGQRKGAIMWQGFAAGRKVLSARARLDAAAAGPQLPLQVAFARRGGGLDVRLRNATQTAVPTYAGNGVPASVAKVLDGLRADPTGRTLGPSVYISVKGTTRPIQIKVAAPLLVKGSIATGARSTRHFRFVLGGGRPLQSTVHVPDGRPRLELTVTPIVPSSLLRPPRGRSWSEAVRLDRRISGRRLLAHALTTGLTLARGHQYDTFLENPDPRGPSTASYVYRSTSKPASASIPDDSSDGSIGAVVIALIAAAMVVGAGGLVVLWAHS